MGIASALLDIIAPTRCGGCDLPGSLLCDECRSALPTIQREYRCSRCGAPYGHLTCTECWQTDFAFEEVRAHCVLEPPVSRCVTLFKDGGERRMSGPLAQMLLAAGDEWLGWAEAIVPIPATPRAIRRRGFDHGATLAQELARQSGLPCLELLGSCGARDQRLLGRTARLANTASGFELLYRSELPRYPLIVDDVMTTGATVDAASRLLIEGGVSEVRACVVARVW